MRTIIVGCGRVGANLAGRLVREGDEVTVIDLRTEAFDRLEDDFPGQANRADGTDEDALRRAGAEGADRFFALTEGDNRNILAAQLAAERFAIKTVVAKINDPVRAEAYAALGLATICRTTMMVETLSRFLGLSWDKNQMRVQAPTGSHHETGHALATVQSED
jgi:trk system potassium uptake protein TrkA